jgi:transcriptional regulator with XRE-family HTH domain
MTTQRPTAYRLRGYDHAMITLARMRADQELTYAQTAARTTGACTGSQIATWERGVYEPRARSLFAYADALGYDLALIPREDT